MKSIYVCIVVSVLALICCLSMAATSAAEKPLPAVQNSRDEELNSLKSRIAESSKNLKDIMMTANVTYKNKRALAKVEENFTRLYEFKTANIMAKMPDKLKTEGRLGMLKFEYIVNGTTRIVKVPGIRLNKKEDYADRPSKVQDFLDIGLLTQSVGKIRQIKIVTEQEDIEKNEIRINAAYPNNTMQNLFWLDSDKLYIKRFEKRDPVGNLTIRLEYSDPKLICDSLWFPTTVEIFAPDGERAGAMKITDLKINTDISDKLFEQ